MNSTTARSLVLVDAPASSRDAQDGWARLDSELARWLRTRTTLRAARSRPISALDDVAMGLRRVRATLGAIGASVMQTGTEPDEAVSSLLSLTYRWAIRVARELEGIEQLELDALEEWTHFEAFAPFALAFFDSALAAPFAACRASNGEVARLRREIDAVLGPLATAMTSSAWAA